VNLPSPSVTTGRPEKNVLFDSENARPFPATTSAPLTGFPAAITTPVTCSAPARPVIASSTASIMPQVCRIDSPPQLPASYSQFRSSHANSVRS
jgi:hypothetical protein